MMDDIIRRVICGGKGAIASLKEAELNTDTPDAQRNGQITVRLSTE